MKRLMPLFLTMCIFLAGCGIYRIKDVVGDISPNDFVPQRYEPNGVSVSSTDPDTVVTDDDHDVNVGNGYEYWGYLFHNRYSSEYVCVVKNTSRQTLELEANAIGYSKSGNAAGADQGRLTILAPGEETAVMFYFSSTEVSDVKVELYPSTTNGYLDPFISDMEIEDFVYDGRIVERLTNKKNKRISSVTTIMVFFDTDGNPIGFEHGDFGGIGGIIDSKESFVEQYDTPKEYDHYKVYVSGWCYIDQSRTDRDRPSSTDDDFEVTEYVFNRDKEKNRIAVIKNNSDEILTFMVGIIGYDKKGQMISADKTYISVIGPGEEGVAEFYFFDEFDIDHAEYHLDYKLENYYVPMARYTEYSCEYLPETSEFAVSVTNTADEPIQQVYAHVLFFDENDNLIKYASTYVMGDDYTIAPGATESDSIYYYGDMYDHYKVIIEAVAN